MENRGIGLFLLLALGVVGILIATRSSKPVQAAPLSGSTPNYQPVARSSYKNTETREISYNSDGLPIKIVIYREADVR